MLTTETRRILGCLGGQCEPWEGFYYSITTSESNLRTSRPWRLKSNLLVLVIVWWVVVFMYPKKPRSMTTVFASKKILMLIQDQKKDGMIYLFIHPCYLLIISWRDSKKAHRNPSWWIFCLKSTVLVILWYALYACIVFLRFWLYQARDWERLRRFLLINGSQTYDNPSKNPCQTIIIYAVSQSKHQLASSKWLASYNKF